MKIDILSLFPSYFRGPFDESIIKRAREKSILTINLIDIRDFVQEKKGASRLQVDDRPYGGGPGMVLMPEPTRRALGSVKREGSKVIYLTAQGKPLTAAKCRQLASCDHLILLCGHYEGIDERVILSDVDEEISIGDYVLTNGCLPAIVLVDAVVRYLPGVLGNEETVVAESFEKELLDCPHFTRPPDLNGLLVPEVLLSGDHERIKKWRYSASLSKTHQVRPECFVKHLFTLDEKEEKICGIYPYLLVKNLERSIKFYTKIVGFKLVGKCCNRAVLKDEESLHLFGLIEADQDFERTDFMSFMEMNFQDRDAFTAFTSRLYKKIRDMEAAEGATEVTFTDLDGHLWHVSFKNS